MNTDVLIIGGGPTGLMAATLLQISGINCRILDKATDQARESRALGIHARTLEFFQNIGLVDQLLKQGQIARGLKGYLNGVRRVELDFSDIGVKDTPYPFIFLLSQEHTERILIDYLKAHNISIERSTTLLDFKQQGGSVQARIKLPDGTEEVTNCTYLLGCDGAHSTVREILKIPYKGKSYSYQFIMSDAKVEWEEEHDKIMLFFNDKDIGAFFPLKEKELSRVLTIKEVESQPRTKSTTSYPASLLEIEENFRTATHMDLRLSNPVWVTKYHVHHRLVDKMREGNVFLAGDAAHIHSPIGGQGMNTGMQDVGNLCWKLARVLKGQAPEEILATYQSERWPVAKKLLTYTDNFFSLIVSKNKFIVKTRNILFPILPKTIMSLSFAKKIIFEMISQLGIHYNESPVVFQGSGQRLPNFPIADGIYVFDVIKGYQFHLLIFERETINEKIPGVQIHYIMNSSFKKSGMILVRPDGYVAITTKDCGQYSLGKIKDMLMPTARDKMRYQDVLKKA